MDHLITRWRTNCYYSHVSIIAGAAHKYAIYSTDEITPEESAKVIINLAKVFFIGLFFFFEIFNFLLGVQIFSE